MSIEKQNSTDIGEEKVSRSMVAACVIDGAAEVMALAACSIEESVRLYVGALKLIRAGESLSGYGSENGYFDALVELLKEREALPAEEVNCAS